MKKNICPNSFRLTMSPEIAPADRSVGQRILEAVQSHIPLEQSGVPIFDELPDQVKKSMDIDPSTNLRLDNLDRAQNVIDYYGEKVDAIRVAREAADAAAAKAKASANDGKSTEGAE